jgi:lysophospholipase L1-like esterase
MKCWDLNITITNVTFFLIYKLKFLKVKKTSLQQNRFLLFFNILNVLKTIRKSHPLTPVFWIAITPTVSRWKVCPEIEKANNLIKNICDKKNNTYFIRTDYAFLNDKGEPRDELFRTDKLHLTEQGYAVWSEIIKKEIAKVVPFNYN